MLESIDFYNSAECILGLVETPDLKPPKLGILPDIPTSLEELLGIDPEWKKLIDFTDALTQISRITEKCMKANNQFMCFMDNCDDYMDAWGKIFGASLKCGQSGIDFE